MSNQIVEYIGKEGVRTSRLPLRERLQNPRPGDLVLNCLTEDEAKYPFKKIGKMYRVNHLGSFFDPSDESTVHVCCEVGSAFLGPNGNVSISGGPFASIPLDCLQPAFRLELSHMWNWGDRSPGGGQGVDYAIWRPVFNLVKMPPRRTED